MKGNASLLLSQKKTFLFGDKHVLSICFTILIKNVVRSDSVLADRNQFVINSTHGVIMAVDRTLFEGTLALLL